MKKLMIGLMMLMAVGLRYNESKAAGNFVTPGIYQQEEQKVKIDPDDLPDVVKETIEKQYKAWMIHEAWEITPVGQAMFYQVQLKRGEDLKVINIDQQGKLMERH